jgi:hypothetical protein
MLRRARARFSRPRSLAAPRRRASGRDLVAFVSDLWMLVRAHARVGRELSMLRCARARFSRPRSRAAPCRRGTGRDLVVFVSDLSMLLRPHARVGRELSMLRRAHARFSRPRSRAAPCRRASGRDLVAFVSDLSMRPRDRAAVAPGRASPSREQAEGVTGRGTGSSGAASARSASATDIGAHPPGGSITRARAGPLRCVVPGSSPGLNDHAAAARQPSSSRLRSDLNSVGLARSPASSNGRTADFGSAYWGSNPYAGTRAILPVKRAECSSQVESCWRVLLP